VGDQEEDLGDQEGLGDREGLADHPGLIQWAAMILSAAQTLRGHPQIPGRLEINKRANRSRPRAFHSTAFGCTGWGFPGPRDELSAGAKVRTI
jgi:hypothetical protein